MQKSFGAQNIYIPQNYKKGEKKHKEKEPCDLAWFGNGVLVLFYLTSGNKSLEKQDEHNLKQARKWIHYWRHQSNQKLNGINRFGDSVSISFKEINYCVLLSVVSHSTGIVFHKVAKNKPYGYTCTIPESLIHAISGFHGTVVDLLDLIYKYSSNPRRAILNHNPLGDERLSILIKKKQQDLDSILKLRHDSSLNENDFSFIYEMINLNRLPAPIGDRLVSNSSGRELISSYFADMTARDFIHIAILAEGLIKRTDNAKFSVAGETKGMHLNWIICATSFSSRNMMEYVEPIIKQASERNMPLLVYAYTFEFTDYRSPSMYALPPKRNKSQSEHLVSLTTQRLSIAFSM